MRHLRENDYQELLKCISEAKNAATMEDTNLDQMGDLDAETSPQKPKERVTDFIRRRTRLWRESWLIRPLAEAERILKENARRD